MAVMEAEIQPKRVYVLQVKYPQLSLDRNQTHAFCSVHVESAKIEVWGKFLYWKPKYSRKGTSFSQQSALRYSGKATKLSGLYRLHE